MNVAFHKPWTQESFLDWVGRQEEPYEFDGVGPVAMNGGTFRHSLIGQNITFALRARLHDQGFIVLGAGAGVRTEGGALRYPDALVTRTKPPGSALTVDGVIVAFEVVSPSSERTDRLIKPREYAALPSLRQYIVVEQTFIGLTVFSRTDASAPWSASTIAELGESIALPDVGAVLPIAEIYEGVEFDTFPGDTSAQP